MAIPEPERMSPELERVWKLCAPSIYRAGRLQTQALLDKTREEQLRQMRAELAKADK